MKTIATVGSTGFIAPYLIKRLRKLEYKVLTYHHNQELDFKEVDYVFYLCSYGNHYHQQDDNKIIKVNTIDYIKLLKYLKDKEVKGIIYFSTSSVTLPKQTTYSDSKFISELLGKRYWKKYRKPVVSIRPASVYGEGEADFRFIPQLVKHYKEDKPMPFSDGWHDWIYISDFIDGVVLVMDNIIKFAGKSVPIGTGISTNNREIFDLMGRISDNSIERFYAKEAIRDYDTRNWVSDPTLIKSLGWKQEVPLLKGLQRCYGYY